MPQVVLLRRLYNYSGIPSSFAAIWRSPSHIIILAVALTFIYFHTRSQQSSLLKEKPPVGKRRNLSLLGDYISENSTHMTLPTFKRTRTPPLWPPPLPCKCPLDHCESKALGTSPRCQRLWFCFHWRIDDDSKTLLFPHFKSNRRHFPMSLHLQGIFCHSAMQSNHRPYPSSR